MAENLESSPETKKSEDKPGKVYHDTAELLEDVEVANASTLRFWGLRLIEKPSSTRPGSSYFELEEDRESGDSFVDAVIHKVKYRDKPEHARFQLNFFAPDKAKYPGPVNWFELVKAGVSKYRIEVLSKER